MQEVLERRRKKEMDERNRKNKERERKIRTGELVYVKAFIQGGPTFLKLFVPAFLCKLLQEKTKNNTIQLGKFMITSIEQALGPEGAKDASWYSLNGNGESS